MNRCKDCKYFGEEIMYATEEDFDNSTGFHTCDRIKHADCSEFDLHELAEKAAVQDGSGYFAALRVKDDFGCVMWEEKI